MKQCPTCQKEFPDSMRFCQTDGTPLVEKAEKAPPPDPYKTVVGGSIKMDEDLLQLPPDDPNKTMVSPISMPKAEAPKSEPPKPFNEAPKVENRPQTPPPAPKFEQPGMNEPKFGNPSPSSNVSGSSSSIGDSPKVGSIPPPNSFNAPPKSDVPPVKNDPLPPPSFGSSPFSNEGGKSESPFDKLKSPPSSSPFDKPAGAPSSSPFEKTPPPPFKDPEPKFGGQQSSPFGQSPFDQPKTPFGQQNEPANQGFQQNDWTPPPAPVAGWQEQGVGANTPFQPPVAGGQNQILPIISLVLGIISLCCYIAPITGLAALITGFMGMKNANNDPAQYGGKTLAIVGMILGGLFFLVGVAYYIFWLVLGLAAIPMG